MADASLGVAGQRPRTAARTGSGATWDARRLLSAALLAAPLAIVVLVGVVTQRPALSGVTGDLRVYFDDSARLIGGAVPYRGFSLEYPPLALLPMTLPRLVWPFGAPDEDTYQWLFGAMEGALAVAVGWLLVRASGEPVRTAALWVALVLASAASVTWRYDLWPAAAVLIAVLAADRGRPALAGVAIGTGTMLKLFPIVVLPILVARAIALHDRRGLGRLVAGTVGAIAVVLGGAFALAGTDSFGWLRYELDRGLQLESTGSGALLLLHVVADLPYRIVRDFGTLQVDATGAGLVAAGSTVVEVILVAGVAGLAYLRFRSDERRTGTVARESLVAATVAILVGLIVASKVFSVQYIVWFLPLVPFLPARMRLLALAVTGLSTLIYPLNYFALWHLDPVLAVALNIRNLLLVALFAWLAVLLRPDRSDRTVAALATGRPSGPARSSG